MTRQIRVAAKPGGTMYSRFDSQEAIRAMLVDGFKYVGTRNQEYKVTNRKPAGPHYRNDNSKVIRVSASGEERKMKVD